MTGLRSADGSPKGKTGRYPLSDSSRSTSAAGMLALMATVQKPLEPGFNPRGTEV
ncbi:MAG TPA: hypothetical protein VIM11_01950 [Tepidisphaeraceae bacterium]